MRGEIQTQADEKDDSPSCTSQLTVLLPLPNLEFKFNCIDKLILSENNDGMINHEASNMLNENSLMLSKAKMKKRVEFSDKNGFVFTIGRKEITSLEKCATWYSRRELSDLKFEASLVVEAFRFKRIAMSENTFVLGAGYQTCRGLERFVDQTRGSIQEEEKRVLIRSVLKEQSRQRSCGISDRNILRTRSILRSYKGRVMARALGRQDAIRSTSTQFVQTFKECRDFDSTPDKDVMCWARELALTHSSLNGASLQAAHHSKDTFNSRIWPRENKKNICLGFKSSVKSNHQQERYQMRTTKKLNTIDAAKKCTETANLLDLKSECTSILLRDNAVVKSKTSISIECVDECNGVKVLVADTNDDILETILVQDESSNSGNSGSECITNLKSGSSSLSQSCDSKPPEQSQTSTLGRRDSIISVDYSLQLYQYDCRGKKLLKPFSGENGTSNLNDSYDDNNNHRSTNKRGEFNKNSRYKQRKIFKLSISTLMNNIKYDARDDTKDGVRDNTGNDRRDHVYSYII